MDVGAGDGGYVLHRARTEPDTFAIAIDASPDALTAGAWRAKRARMENVAFLVECVERLPRELTGIADEVVVQFPWGSLSRGLIDASPDVLRPIAGLMKVDAELRVLMSGVERDATGELAPTLVTARSPSYAECGLRLLEAEWARRAIIDESHSSWAKRLAVGRARRGVFARYRRAES